jgi:thioredoxin-like negative regulator of GroEL
MPMAEEMGKPLFPVDIKNKKAAWDQYKIEGTPTLIHFKDGKEAGKIVGEQPQATFRDFLSK